ncbi:hypothetical protein [Desulfosporosinus sp. Sb-LF]|uniref:hypothetical protein n=1 Tax=Desulfosporosinus sp. Sb-LF TaxID=2560027 RepID=UPI00107F5DF5|nr:hypothetical protein [Desulfosporosinus sp. Sb-LF]TGE31447.1 hypothetical protein E4K68_17115 [Desulfosporosinus sp. Sb-LF]
MIDEVKGSINDVDSFSQDEKTELVEKSFVAITAVSKKKGKARKTEVAMGTVNGMKLFTYGIDESIKSRSRPKPEDRIRAMGLEKVVTEKIVSEIKEGKVTSRHLDDLVKTNLIEEISKLDSKSQQEITQTLFDNKNERNAKNTEDISVVILQNGTISNYLTENWYSGLLRTIIKLSQQASVNKEILDELSDEQNCYLTGCTKDLKLILDNMLKSLNPDQV